MHAFILVSSLLINTITVRRSTAKYFARVLGATKPLKLPSIPLAEEMMTHHFADKSADCCVTALVLGEWQRSGYRRRVFFSSQTQCGTARRLEWRHRSSQLQSTGLFWGGRRAASSRNTAPLLFAAQESFSWGGAALNSTTGDDKRSKTNSGKTWIYARDINRSFGEASSDCILVAYAHERWENGLDSSALPVRPITNPPSQCPDVRSNGPVRVDYLRVSSRWPRRSTVKAAWVVVRVALRWAGLSRTGAQPDRRGDLNQPQPCLDAVRQKARQSESAEGESEAHVLSHTYTTVGLDDSC